MDSATSTARTGELRVHLHQRYSSRTAESPVVGRVSAIPNAHTLLMNPGDKVTFTSRTSQYLGSQDSMRSLSWSRTRRRSHRLHAGLGEERVPEHVDCQLRRLALQLPAEYATPRQATTSLGCAADQHQHGVRDRPLRALHEPLAAFTTNPIDPFDTGGVYNGCSGPYETAGLEGHETGTPCATRPVTSIQAIRQPTDTVPPNEATGCQDNWFQNGDLDSTLRVLRGRVAHLSVGHAARAVELRRVLAAIGRGHSYSDSSSSPTSRSAS